MNPKTCRKQTKASVTKTATTEVATTSRCRDSINISGQLIAVQKEVHRNYGPTSEPYKYTAAEEEKQLRGNLKERSGLLKAPVFLFFLFFSFLLFLF